MFGGLFAYLRAFLRNCLISHRILSSRWLSIIGKETPIIFMCGIFIVSFTATGVKVQGAVTTEIYQKSLRLSQKSRMEQARAALNPNQHFLYSDITCCIFYFSFSKLLEAPENHYPLCIQHVCDTKCKPKYLFPCAFFYF